jgi:hypothetical protein
MSLADSVTKLRPVGVRRIFFNKLADGKLATDYRAIFNTQDIRKVTSDLISSLFDNDNETFCPFITKADLTTTHSGTAYDDTLGDDLNKTCNVRINVISRRVRIPKLSWESNKYYTF